MVEFQYNLRKKNPFLDDAQVGGIRRRLESTFGEDSRISGYTVDPAGNYPDVGDAHVHCAAVHGSVDLLLTNNVKHFRESTISPTRSTQPTNSSNLSTIPHLT
ncbi:hypothetical protein GS416_11870 [Rhodococcus hoagii]|nr:hypothetical protein [Prescottella equi]